MYALFYQFTRDTAFKLGRRVGIPYSHRLLLILPYHLIYICWFALMCLIRFFVFRLINQFVHFMLDKFAKLMVVVDDDVTRKPLSFRFGAHNGVQANESNRIERFSVAFLLAAICCHWFQYFTRFRLCAFDASKLMIVFDAVSLSNCTSN